MMKSKMAAIHKVLTGFVSLAVFVQMFLAGIWHAEVVSTPDAHVFLGLGMLLASLLALIAAAVGKMPRRIIGPTALLFGLMLAQPVLIEMRRMGVPFLSAFHAVNAAFIGMTSGAVMTAGSKASAAARESEAYQPATGD
jgi:hypothetical protein